MTKISVVIPSYNHRRYIGAALRSLEEQTFRDFDVWIVDDGSTDDSVRVIESFINASSLPITLVTQPNAGAHTALNRAIQMSHGDIVAILNSDDEYHPMRLERIEAAASPNTPFIAFSKFQFIGEEGLAIPDDAHNIWYREALAEYETLPSVGFMLIRSNISATTTSNYVFSRTLYGEVGPFRNFKTAHDLDFLLRCVQLVEPLFIQEQLLNYRIHGKNTINLNRDIEFQEVRALLDDYVRAVTAHIPKNCAAPGARQLSLYSRYFFIDRDHWSGPLSDELRLALCAALDSAPTGADALAFRLEVERLKAELRGKSKVEYELLETAMVRQNLLERLEALQTSTSWKVTAPLRKSVSVWRALVANRKGRAPI